MADIEAPLQYGRITGSFWAVLEDSPDEGSSPDSYPLTGTVTFTPSYDILRVTSDDVTKRGIVYVDKVTAHVIDGVLVDDVGTAGVSLLATTEEDGSVFPHNISWTATFNLTMYNGEKLKSQPEQVQIRLNPGESRAISDFTPAVLHTGTSLRVLSVDQETLTHVTSQVEYIDNLVNTLDMILEDGVARGEKGDDGDVGPTGPPGVVGPPGRSSHVETFNFARNPVPTSNNGYIAENGTLSYSNNSLTLTPTDYTLPSVFRTSVPVTAYPSTNMYLSFKAETTNDAEIVSNITFLGGSLQIVDSSTMIHSGAGTLDGVTSDESGTYSHTAYTHEAASFAVFSIGILADSPEGSTLTAKEFFFSDSPGSFFTGSDTIEGYKTRWVGAENNSYSVLTPTDLLSSFTVTSINGENGDLEITPETLGLGFVDNTSDADKPISDATQDALDDKLDTGDLRLHMSMFDGHIADMSYLQEFSKYATQEVWKTSNTFVDIAYTRVPDKLVRMVIPGTTSGNSASSIPTVQTSIDGETWTTWKQLTSAPPSTLKYTNIDGDYDRSTGNLKIVVREETTGGAVTLRLHVLTPGGTLTSSVLSTDTKYNSPSIVPSLAGDGSFYLYYVDGSGVTKRASLWSNGTIGTTVSTPTGVKANSPMKVSKYFGAYVAATNDGSIAGSPGILISSDGISWKSKGVTATHTWARGADVRAMASYPGVSRGKVGIFVDYINKTDYTLSRLFATSNPFVSGAITGVSTNSKLTSSSGTSFAFPGTLQSVPRVVASSNDSKLNLAVVGITVDGGTVERFNMGETTSSNATIVWAVLS